MSVVLVNINTYEELRSFIMSSLELKDLVSLKELEDLSKINLEDAKRKVFKLYQDTFVYHDSARLNTIEYDKSVILKVYTTKNSDTINYIKMYIKNKYPDISDELFTFVHRFISLERD